MLYMTEQFKLLERGLEEISALGKVGESGWPLETILYKSIYDWTSASKTESGELPRIQRWKKTVPDSVFVHLAEAVYLINKAWSIRGGGYADTVSAESWKLFEKYHRDAENVLLSAPKKLRNYPAWYQAMMAPALELGSPAKTPDQLVEEVAEKWPDFYPIYESVARRLQPKWGSSWRQLEKFASKWTAYAAGKRADGDALYARIYLVVRNDGPVDEIRPDWEKLKKGFEMLISTRPKFHNYKNHYASFACAMRDKAAFTSAMKMINKDSLRTDAWIKGHSYEACKTWGFVAT